MIAIFSALAVLNIPLAGNSMHLFILVCAMKPIMEWQLEDFFGYKVKTMPFVTSYRCVFPISPLF
jgi:hypothetical protein